MSVNLDSIVQVIATRFKIDASRIVPEASFDELGLDSLSQIELALSLKKDLGISISDDELAQISTVSDIFKMVNKTC
ncbi:MAG TPA: acyl carrier protein [Candidatus Angelobacter sp.]|nr:acyl carrier protein [Candidatus Angelobacter sp.]